MKELIKSYRYWMVGLIGMLAFVLLVAEPKDTQCWLKTMLWSKALGFLLLTVAVKIFKYWVKKIDIDE